jgi:flagellar biosynthetic protein FliR
MPAEIPFPYAALCAFLVVLARVGGALTFVPWPGSSGSPVAARVALAVAVTVALAPAWPAMPQEAPTAGRMLVWLAAEAAFGVTAGVMVSFISEGFVMAAQIFGLQAGYSYASTIDPTTQADSSVLQTMTLLMASLLFVVLGLDRQVLLAFSRSLESWPPGAYRISGQAVEDVVRLGSAMLTTALRLALPVVALLALVDLALALLSRVNAQLQLLSLAFPAKMLASMALLAALAGMTPALYQEAAERSFGALFRLAGGGR